MANLTKNNKASNEWGEGLFAVRTLPVSGTVHIYAGQVLTTNTGSADNHRGYVGPALINSGNYVVGIAMHEVDNTNGTSGAAYVNVANGIFPLSNSNGAISLDNVNSKVYLVDDHTVTASVSDVATGRPLAGTVYMADPSGQIVWVHVASGQTT